MPAAVVVIAIVAADGRMPARPAAAAGRCHIHVFVVGTDHYDHIYRAATVDMADLAGLLAVVEVEYFQPGSVCTFAVLVAAAAAAASRCYNLCWVVEASLRFVARILRAASASPCYNNRGCCE